MTNCFDMTDSIYGESCAMYLALARLNHSCSPNVQQTHYPDTTEEVLYACRDIKQGDEINDCYIDLRQCRADRQAALLEFYRFTCTCSACSLETELMKKDDQVRVRAADIVDQIVALLEEGEDGSQSLAFDAAVQSVRLLEDARFTSWSVRYVAECCLSVYQIALSMADRELALRYLERAHRWNVQLQGERSPDSRKTAALIETFSIS